MLNKYTFAFYFSNYSPLRGPVLTFKLLRISFLTNIIVVNKYYYKQIYLLQTNNYSPLRGPVLTGMCVISDLRQRYSASTHMRARHRVWSR